MEQGVGEIGLSRVRMTTRGMSLTEHRGQRPSFSAGWSPGLDPVRGGQTGVSDRAHLTTLGSGQLGLFQAACPWDSRPRFPQSRGIAAAQMRLEAAEAPGKPQRLAPGPTLGMAQVSGAETFLTGRVDAARAEKLAQALADGGLLGPGAGAVPPALGLG